MSELLFIGCSSWIIFDGNYGDFEVGQHAKFALEFNPRSGLRRVDDAPPVAERLVGTDYAIRAKVIFSSASAWAIDCGSFIAYRKGKPPAGVVSGACVEGQLYLGIDPFYYFEELHRLSGMPPLSYRWVVREILTETTPWIRTDPGSDTFNRDPRRRAYVPVRAMKAREEDDGTGHYVLGCERIGGPELPF